MKVWYPKRLLEIALLFLLSCAPGCTPGEGPAYRPPKRPADTTWTLPTKPLRPYGTDVGSASDNTGIDSGVAWWTGKRKSIRICYEISEDFGVEKEVAEAAINEAFQVWATYLDERQPQPTGEPFAWHAQYDPPILGCPDPAPESLEMPRGFDLAIYLGVSNAKVNYFKPQFRNPTAFVQRLEFDRDALWGRGFIWVAAQDSVRFEEHLPTWTADGALTATLMHELGHIYGNDHIAGTIMMADISQRIQLFTSDRTITPQARAKLVSVDYCRELAPCANCGYLYPFDLKGKDQANRELVELLAGGPVEDEPVLILSRSVGLWNGFTLLAKPKPQSKATALSTYEIWPFHEHDLADQSSGLAAFKIIDQRGIVWSLPDKTMVQTKIVKGPGENEDSTDILNEATGKFPEPTGKEIEFVVETNMATCTAHPYHNRDDANGRDPIMLHVRRGMRKATLARFKASAKKIRQHSTPSSESR